MNFRQNPEKTGYFSSSPRKQTSKLNQILQISGKQCLQDQSSGPSLNKTNSTSLILNPTKSLSSHKESGDLSVFSRFFKKSEEKHFVKPGKTEDVYKNAKRSSIFDQEYTKKAYLQTEPHSSMIKSSEKCPFQSLSKKILSHDQIFLEKDKIDINNNNYFQKDNKELLHSNTVKELILNEECLKEFFEKDHKKKFLKSKDCLLSRLGGLESLSHILQAFLKRVYRNASFTSYFQGCPMEKILDELKYFFTKEFSKQNFSVLDYAFLQSRHKQMNISHEVFDIFKGLLAITLRSNEFSLDEEIVVEVLSFLELARRHIVNEVSAFEKILKKIDVSLLNEKILDRIRVNSLLNRLFEGWDSEKHKKHLEMIYSYLIKDQYVMDAYLRDSHKALGLNSHIFYHFKQVFTMSLRELKVEEELIFEVMEKIEKVRRCLLNEPSYYEIVMRKFDINSLIRSFLVNIKANPFLFSIFKNKNETNLLNHCKYMLTFCLSGPSQYQGCDITPAHLPHKLTKEHYLAMREALEKTLVQTNLREQEIIYILADLDYYKYDICNEKCLLEKLGNPKNIEFIVQSFYLKAFQHPKLCQFYKNTEPVSMIRNQKFFFTNFFQAKKIKSHHFKDLRTFHLNMPLTEEHFRFFVESLVEITKELNIEDNELKKEIIEWMSRTKNDVLNKKMEERDFI